MNGHEAEHHNFDYDPGYPQTYEGDFDNAYDRVTAGDIADLLHHLAEMRCNTPAGRPHPAELPEHPPDAANPA